MKYQIIREMTVFHSVVSEHDTKEEAVFVLSGLEKKHGKHYSIVADDGSRPSKEEV